MNKTRQDLYTIAWTQVYTEWISEQDLAEEAKLFMSDLKEAKELIKRIKEL